MARRITQAERAVNITPRPQCPHCGGNGKCRHCEGTGWQWDISDYGLAGVLGVFTLGLSLPVTAFMKGSVKCPKCYNSGICQVCNGRGSF